MNGAAAWVGPDSGGSSSSCGDGWQQLCLSAPGAQVGLGGCGRLRALLLQLLDALHCRQQLPLQPLLSVCCLLCQLLHLLLHLRRAQGRS
jgi:hypothetical protein